LKISVLVVGLLKVGRVFRADRSGQIAVIFGLSSVMIVTAAGAGMDLSRAYMARQKLSEVATLACQYASRPSIVQTSLASYSGSNGGTTYVTQVTNFITSSLQSQNFILSQTNGTPFTYTQNGTADVRLTATVPTTFMKIANVQTVPITVQRHCFDSPASVIQRVPDGNSTYLVQESFEANGVSGSWHYFMPNGTVNTTGNPSPTAFNNTVNYTGSKGNQWYTTGYCIEQDAGGVIKSSAADGSFSVELDCDNGSGTKGNSALSTKTYLAAGAYELRFFYASRVLYLNYAPTYLCGSAASDLSWANDTSSSGGPVANALRTNQMNVYLDLNTSGSPPTHTTIDGTQTLAGSNLIDMCVYGQSWLERSVSITVTTPGYYWLSFAADGLSDSYGAQLDNIRLCPNTCPASVQDNFPTAWSSGTILFEDTFETPYYYTNGALYYGNGNIFLSTGTSGTSSSGWPSETATGWHAEPVNQVNFIFSNATQGKQTIELDADTNIGGVASSQRSITRKFLLVPGYYQVSYMYKSNVTFSSLGSTVYCGATPTLANISGLSGTATGNTSYTGGGNATWNKDTNIIGVFMSHDQLASNPNTAALSTAVTYLNPSGTTTSSPTVPDDNINLSLYNSSQVNPLLDICGYALNWQTRTANIKIVKPSYYWLTFASLGTADKAGGAIDDVKLTALGSLYMSAPSGAVTIPVPDPQPGATISYTGFSFTANRLTP
jgi:Flp pilus assembly protein TadG